MRRSLWIALASLSIIGACTGSEIVGEEPSDSEVSAPDTDAGDSGDTPDTPPQCKPATAPEFGSCDSNDDCPTGICYGTPDGNSVCTNVCETGSVCPCDWRCRFVPLLTDAFSICTPPVLACDSCKDDADCNAGKCVLFPEPGGDKGFCLDPCGALDSCPAGFGCEDVDGTKLCRPNNGSCTCRDAEDQGTVRSCSNTNEVGTCTGNQTCDLAQGWSTCTASVPSAEICNGFDDNCNGSIDEGHDTPRACEKTNEAGTCEGTETCLGSLGYVCNAVEPAPEICDTKDNNCDGTTDEGFQTDGIYDGKENCGTCGTNCDTAVSGGTGKCVVTDGTASCTVDQCDSGKVQVDPLTCVGFSTFCQPCTSDAECSGGVCRSFAGGNFCTTACASAADCVSANTVCADMDDLDGEPAGTHCAPLNGTCDCNASTSGLTRPCEVTNALGTCKGSETCEPANGWVGCSAPEPAAEICDFADNDCDGNTDEDFKTDGKYASVEHCGTCNTNCDTALPTAETTQCTVPASGTPSCEVVTCPEGQVKVSPTMCGASSYCTSCTTDADCVQAKCVTIDGGGFCAPDCGSGQECPASAACGAATNVGGGAETAVCVPVTNSCDCDASKAGTIRICSKSNAFGECTGTETCTPPTGWVGCSAAVPAAEICDGFDNDCNGPSDDGLVNQPCEKTNAFGTCSGTATCKGVDGFVCDAPAPVAETCNFLDEDCDGSTDEDFKTGDLYTADTACGSCSVNCVSKPGLTNGTGVCDSADGTPSCCVGCDPGFFDVDKDCLTCECEFKSDTDLPDYLDGPTFGPNGAATFEDANCDGVDGEADNAVFVSVNTGDDGNPGTRELPVKTIGRGQSVADSTGLRDVYVAEGTYDEDVLIIGGVDIYGGFSSDFSKHNRVTHKTIIRGLPTPPSESACNGDITAHRAALTCDGITGGEVGSTIIQGFEVRGPSQDATCTNSYALYVSDCDDTVVFRSMDLRGGKGGPGRDGTQGIKGIDGAAGNTPPATAYDIGTRACDNAIHTRAGGAGGVTVCPVGDVSGGQGGEADCPKFSNSLASPPSASSAGSAGSAAPGGTAGNGGAAGWDSAFQPGVCNFCQTPVGGTSPTAGVGTNGTPGFLGDGGDGCTEAAGVVVNGHWQGLTGTAGVAGQAGSGGGGGGSGGGVEMLDTTSCVETGAAPPTGPFDWKGDDVAGPGGGGGAGGCGGQGGGEGAAGGGAFALFLNYTSEPLALPTLLNTTILLGTGGKGGAGGGGAAGGAGGSGGPGGAGGSGSLNANDPFWCARAGEEGGDGGTGGEGGGGGAGCGGVSYGIFLAGLADPTALGAALLDAANGNVFQPGGAGGPGGTGGASPTGVVSGGSGATGVKANTNF
ncbi:MAG: hypothetical protein H6746_02525 [Deltaproteobacteria bacterium]|nr:hypothetical protein [Deltaproteobacteria bacterium]